jgi:hypothetical protein
VCFIIAMIALIPMWPIGKLFSHSLYAACVWNGTIGLQTRDDAGFDKRRNGFDDGCRNHLHRHEILRWARALIYLTS